MKAPLTLLAAIALAFTAVSCETVDYDDDAESVSVRRTTTLDPLYGTSSTVTTTAVHDD